MTKDLEERRAALVAAHEARLQGLLGGDLDVLSRVVGEDLVYVSSFGRAQGRPDVFASFQAGTLKIEKMDASDLDVRLYGAEHDVGIIIYQADARMIDGDTVVEGITRSTTIYVLRDEGWQMVSQHQSRVE